MELLALALTGIGQLVNIAMRTARASAAEKEELKAELLKAIGDLKAKIEVLDDDLRDHDTAVDKALADKFRGSNG